MILRFNNINKIVGEMQVLTKATPSPSQPSLSCHTSARKLRYNTSHFIPIFFLWKCNVVNLKYINPPPL